MIQREILFDQVLLELLFGVNDLWIRHSLQILLVLSTTILMQLCLVLMTKVLHQLFLIVELIVRAVLSPEGAKFLLLACDSV